MIAQPYPRSTRLYLQLQRTARNQVHEISAVTQSYEYQYEHYTTTSTPYLVSLTEGNVLLLTFEEHYISCSRPVQCLKSYETLQACSPIIKAPKISSPQAIFVATQHLHYQLNTQVSFMSKVIATLSSRVPWGIQSKNKFKSLSRSSRVRSPSLPPAPTMSHLTKS